MTQGDLSGEVRSIVRINHAADSVDLIYLKSETLGFSNEFWKNVISVG